MKMVYFLISYSILMIMLLEILRFCLKSANRNCKFIVAIVQEFLENTPNSLIGTKLDFGRFSEYIRVMSGFLYHLVTKSI